MTNEQQRILTPIFAELRDSRILLRGLHDDDAQAFFEALVESRDLLRPWDNDNWFDTYQSPDDARAWLRKAMARWLLREQFQIGIWDLQSARFLGQMMLIPCNWAIPSFEIGYWLRTSAGGKGYMTEALQLLTDYAFDQLAAKRVMLRIDERNKASIALAERLHFRREGTLRNQELAADGSLCNMIIFALTPEDRSSLAM